MLMLTVLHMNVTVSPWAMELFDVRNRPTGSVGRAQLPKIKGYAAKCMEHTRNTVAWRAGQDTTTAFQLAVSFEEKTAEADHASLAVVVEEVTGLQDLRGVLLHEEDVQADGDATALCKRLFCFPQRRF